MHFEVKNANLKFQKALNARVGSPVLAVFVNLRKCRAITKKFCNLEDDIFVFESLRGIRAL